MIKRVATAESLRAFGAGTARAQTRPQNRSLKLRRGAFCVAVRADAESADGTGRRARQRRVSRDG
eukprot:1853800-Alexandrium_andersonii.AAC.1